MLVEEGRLRLDTPVWTILGRSWHRSNMNVYVGGTKEALKTEKCQKNINISHLLTHTCGVSAGFHGTELYNPIAGIHQDKTTSAPTGFREVGEVHATLKRRGLCNAKVSTQEYCDKLAQIPLVCQPGSGFHYGDGTAVLGAIVEAVSGEKFSSFLERRIFKPLGMFDTGFVVPTNKQNRFANCWYSQFLKKRVDITDALADGGDHVPEKAVTEHGGGGLVSTSRDYFKFVQCLLSGGVTRSGQRLLSRKTVEYMATNHLPEDAEMTTLNEKIKFSGGYTESQEPGIGFGLGFSVILDPIKAYGGGNVSTGTIAWAGLAGTFFYIDPAEELVVIFMTQCIGLDQLMLPYRTIIRNVVSGAIADGPLRPQVAPKLRSKL
eukprot:gnl/TRDRNA2_/TRDRNA2_205357_c0_seq1.p1 gnl/TRDRNA2_/TRDRNA2_205357_c0~~gnl/TRDRNA2_/TRDRNA2_205357_c0_seq1.p1  ORF type:complete len:416 (-),score=51.82 gnl/TRDRNA2_/TRDRNA2_205357_c0_seq1:66-1196(-)